MVSVERDDCKSGEILRHYDRQKETRSYCRKNIKTSWLAKLLGLHIQDKINFNLHITKIYRSTANQLPAVLWRKETLINSYFYSTFNYCPLVSMFSSAKSLNKVESLQKKALRFLYANIPYTVITAWQIITLHLK